MSKSPWATFNTYLQSTRSFVPNVGVVAQDPAEAVRPIQVSSVVLTPPNDCAFGSPSRSFFGATFPIDNPESEATPGERRNIESAIREVALFQSERDVASIGVTTPHLDLSWFRSRQSARGRLQTYPPKAPPKTTSPNRSCPSQLLAIRLSLSSSARSEQ